MTQSLFSDHDGISAGDEGEYRPISHLAVAAAVVGVLSTLALAGPPLWFVPVVGVILSSISLASLGRERSELLGRGASLCGLALAVAFGAAGVTTWLSSPRLAERHAVEVAETWVRLIRDGRLLDARDMLSPEARPVAGHTVSGGDDNLSKPIDDSVGAEAAFRSLPAVAAILACQGRPLVAGSFHLHLPESQEQNEAWQVRVRLAPCEEGDGVMLLLHFRRAMQPAVDTVSGWAENWSITSVELGG